MEADDGGGMYDMLSISFGAVWLKYVGMPMCIYARLGPLALRMKLSGYINEIFSWRLLVIDFLSTSSRPPYHIRSVLLLRRVNANFHSISRQFGVKVLLWSTKCFDKFYSLKHNGNYKNHLHCAHSLYMCFLWFSKWTSIIFINILPPIWVEAQIIVTLFIVIIKCK